MSTLTSQQTGPFRGRHHIYKTEPGEEEGVSNQRVTADEQPEKPSSDSTAEEFSKVRTWRGMHLDHQQTVELINERQTHDGQSQEMLGDSEK
ncbi:hypothetical protein C0Q70_03427 [Pomacea canaliculata]|uniref:Uncharacterized protein n=1 Tax=Pomacea canaliculata TaxID=400727 RepID=A0A2T7PSM9_POMCA|nr:hypothetical protein C0Q70_03427 [Pomacea canaliculata]